MKLLNQFTILKKNLRDIDYLTKEKLILEKRMPGSSNKKETLSLID